MLDQIPRKCSECGDVMRCYDSSVCSRCLNPTPVGVGNHYMTHIDDGDGASASWGIAVRAYENAISIGGRRANR